MYGEYIDIGYIYKIVNKVNNKIYIGQTSKTIEERFKAHLQKANQHINRYLYDAMNHYGYDNFQIFEIEKCDDNCMNEREIYWIEKLNTIMPNGYNMTKGGGGGDTWTNNPSKDITIMKLIVGNRGKKRSDAFCKNLSEKLSGRFVSSEQGRMSAQTRKNRLAKERGYSSWEERVEYISMCKKLFRQYEINENGGMINYHHSQETRDKISIAKKNKTYEEIYGGEEANRRKDKLRLNFLGHNNPLYKDVDKDILLKKILQNEKIEDIAKYFSCSKPTIYNKCSEYFGTSKTREVKKLYVK